MTEIQYFIHRIDISRKIDVVVRFGFTCIEKSVIFYFIDEKNKYEIVGKDILKIKLFILFSPHF